MAISPIVVSEIGSSVRTKLNAAITEANKVADKADTTALTAETTARGAAIAAEATARGLAIAAETTARNTANTKLRVNLPVSDRPGEAIEQFTSSIAGGDPALLSALTGTVSSGNNGLVFQQTGPGIVASRGLFAVETGRLYKVRFMVRRRTDSPDAATDSVRLGLALYTSTKVATTVPTVTLTEIVGLLTGQGFQTVEFVVSTAAGVLVDTVIDSLTRFARPYVQTLGHSSAVTDIIVLGWQDVTDILPASNTATPGVSYAITDAAGRVALGVGPSGEVQLRDARVTDLTVTSINSVPYTAPGPVSPRAGALTHQINYIAGNGQSLSEGSEETNGSSISLTTVQEYDNVGFALRATFDTATASGFLPLKSDATISHPTRLESPIFGTAGHIKELLLEENALTWQRADYQLVLANNGYSGKSITQLNKTANTFDGLGGTDAYALMMQQAQAAWVLAQDAGKTMAFQAATLTQGEADILADMDPAVWKAHVATYADDIAADAKVITGQAHDPILIIGQTTSVTAVQAANPNRRRIPWAQLEISNEHPNIYLACPMYFLPYGDEQHITAEGARWYGAYLGLIYKRVIVDRVDWRPLQPIGHRVLGSSVVLRFNKSRLQFDSTLVPAQTNYGFDAVAPDGTTPLTINSVVLTDTDEVTIAFSAPPAAGSLIRYGYQQSTGIPAGGVGTGDDYIGGAGNLRDSQGDIIKYTPLNAPTTPKPMHNWCCIFRYTI